MTAALVNKVQPNWHDDFDNRPDFHVLLGYIPDTSEYLHATNGKGLYRGRINDAVHYMYSDGKPTRGYGGRRITLKMDDGTEREFIGGWSSNAASVNAAWPEQPVVECSVTADKGVMKRGHTFYSGAVTIGSIVEWWLDNEDKIDWGLAIVHDGNSVWLEPTKGRFVKWAHNLRIAFRTAPIHGLRSDENRCRYLDSFWNAWKKTQSLYQDYGGDELDGTQMQAVRA